MIINMVLLVIMAGAALWTVMARSLLRAAIGLAATSAVLTLLIFRLNSPMAAVVELSVCTGLITVIFISTISLTKPLSGAEAVIASKARTKRYWYLPVLILLAGSGLMLLNIPNSIKLSGLAAAAPDVRAAIWNLRQMDLFGQIIIIIVGALAVVILFEKREKDEW